MVVEKIEVCCFDRIWGKKLISSKPFACIGVLFGLGVIIVQTLPGATPVTARMLDPPSLLETMLIFR